MKNSNILRSALLAGLVASLGLAGTLAHAGEPTVLRTGLGQSSPTEPAKISNLSLNHPLIQQKYLNEPDLLRFLRGTYSEACSRGMLDQAAKSVKADVKREYTAEQRQSAASLIESRRIWKMTSFEMEALYGAGYLNSSNYCDCVMREIPDVDLVNPRKGLDVVEKLPESVVTACQATAKEQTERQLKARGKAKESK